MSNITERILDAVKRYEDFLQDLTEEEFQRTPEEGVWSYAELYSHIFQANLGSLIAIERCLHGSKQVTGSPTFFGRLILFFGIFPPVKLKSPARMIGTKITLEEAGNYIARFKSKLADVVPLVRKADLKRTAQHPRLGMLNAPQWLRFVYIHSRHHLKQLARIRKLLATHSINPIP